MALVLALALSEGDDGSDSGGGDARDGGGAQVDLGPRDEASGEPVRVGFVTDGQNPSADQTIDLHVAEATAEYLNTHAGGIGGRPIELVTCEARLDPARGTDCGNRMVEQEVAAVVVGTTGVTEAVWAPLHEAGMPAMFFAGAGDAMLADPEATFSLSDPNGGTIEVPMATARAEGEDRVTVVVIDVPAALEIYESTGGELLGEAGIDLELVPVPPGTADMTAQLQPVVEGDPGVVHVLGNDSFCIAAFQALEALAYDGPLTAISQCITDATRAALPGSALEGVVVGSASPVDAGDESDALYRTVMAEFGDGIDTSRATGHGTFTALAGFAAALEGISGEVTPETVAATIRAMPERDLPGGGGLTFRCDGEQVPGAPAACVAGALVTTLDGEGRPTSYEAVQD